MVERTRTVSQLPGIIYSDLLGPSSNNLFKRLGPPPYLWWTQQPTIIIYIIPIMSIGYPRYNIILIMSPKGEINSPLGKGRFKH